MDSQLQKLSQLPSLPTVAVRLLKMFSDPDVGISEVVSILQTDPALSGKILKAANTSQFGLRKPVSDLQRAVVLLGKKSVMALALGFSLAEASMNTGPYAHLFADFWFQSLVRGCAAALLAEKYTQVDHGEAFTMGLLARIGRLAMLNNDPEQMGLRIQRAEETGLSLSVIESQAGGITSAIVTQHMLSEWKLPAHCLKAVDKIDSTVDEACDNRQSDTVSLTDLLRIATSFSEFFSGENRGIAIARIYELTSAILGESENGANQLVDRIRAELDHHSDLFSVDMAKVGTPMELLLQAMEQLSGLAMNLAINSPAPREEARPMSSEIMEENGRLRKRVMELTQSSFTDVLTSLYNRTFLLQQLQEVSSEAREDRTQVPLLFVDIDHFKRINDTYGHLFGDEVLREVAQALKMAVRETDIVARYGGEEFVILPTSTDRAGLERLAERIRKGIETQGVVCDGVQIQVTASLGAAIAIPELHDDAFPRRLLEAADTAMYLSKRKGRNCVTVVEDLDLVTRSSELLAAAT